MPTLRSICSKIFVSGTAPSVVALGVTTTVGYGTLFYSFAILSGEIIDEFAWSRSFVFGIFSLGLLAGALIAPTTGKLLDSYGARNVMSIGSFFSALALLFAATISSQITYILAILSIEIIATAVLYEAAFVAFSQIAGKRARIPMTQITLIAGFASTIFWPLISWMLIFLSWREVYIALAFFHLLLALPLHYFLLSKGAVIEAHIESDELIEDATEYSEKHRKKSMILLGLTLSLGAIPISIVQVHLIGILEEFGIEMVLAVSLGALIGPSQVGARVVEMLFAKKISPIASGIFSTMMIATAFFSLLLSGYSTLFATLFVILYGAGQGLTYIIRGAIPLYLYGAQGYGKTTGKLNAYRMVLSALAPFGFAILLDNLGIYPSLIIVFAISLLSMLLLLYLSFDIRRFRSKKCTSNF